jgi:hypothetical protein
MNIEDFRVELQALLKKFAAQFDLSDNDCYVMAVTVANISASGTETKRKFYEVMRDFSKKRAKECGQEAEMILAGLDLSDEDKEKLVRIAKGIVEKKDSKVEN